MSQVLLDELSAVRVGVDRCIQQSKQLIQSGESTLAFRSLQMAKGWLGKAKFYSGSQTYAVADKEEEIPPTQDVYEISAGESIFLAEDRLGKVNELREEISTMTDRIGEIPSIFQLENCVSHSLKNSWDHINEANMNLGFELGRMREKALEELAKES